jgi:hypothetical protein
MIYGKRGLAFEEDLSGLLINLSFVTGALLTSVNNPIFFLANFAMMDTLQCCFSDREYHLHKYKVCSIGNRAKVSIRVCDLGTLAFIYFFLIRRLYTEVAFGVYFLPGRVEPAHEYHLSLPP